MSAFSTIDKTWTLFLDRDGVINIEKEDDYIRSVSEFTCIDQAPEAITSLSKRFGKLLIVTNQKGIGKRLMSEADLKEIHDHLIQQVEDLGGRIDKIYYCTDTDAQSPCRKPNTGMALQALKDYPDIDCGRSVMVGNTLSDMRFGKAMGMHTVFILSNKPLPSLPHPDIDMVFPSLDAFAKAL